MAFEKVFYCNRCGAKLPQSGGVCTLCGFNGTAAEPFGKAAQLGAGGIGWSEVLTDPRFGRYQRSRRQYITWFTLILLLVIGLFLFASGQLKADPEGFQVMSVLIILFTAIAGFAIRGTRARGPGWTGTVLAKRGDPDAKYNRQPLEVDLRLESGEMLTLPVADPDWFAALEAGDRIRQHRQANLRTLEKYDKRRDLHLACPACASLNDARADYCQACGSPLLKGRLAEDPSEL